MKKYSRKVLMMGVLLTAMEPLWARGSALLAMALQQSVQVRNAKLDAIETSIGVSPIFEFRTGAPPANCATAPSGTLLAQVALPSDWLTAAAAGVKSKNGTWTIPGLAGIATANIGHFRIYEAGSPSACHMQGTVTATGGGGDMTVDNISLAASQVVTVTAFDLTAGNA